MGLESETSLRVVSVVEGASVETTRVRRSFNGGKDIPGKPFFSPIIASIRDKPSKASRA